MTYLADPKLSMAGWALIIGALMISMALSSTLLKRLPVSASMLYLAVGYALGPAGWGLLTPDPLLHSDILEVITEFALLISLFSVGLKLGLPLRDKRWYLPLLLAFPAMALTVLMIAVIGVHGLGLPLGAAVLLGGILAPTDPVLAADVQVADSNDNDRMRFSLSAEGGLNDGAAFPFIMLGLGLLGLHDLGSGGWRWVIIDLLWGQIGGLLIGALLGIRGIGSVYYLTYVINHSLAGSLVGEITALTLATVAASILLHGVSVTPLMDFYARRSLRRRRSRHP